MTFRVQSCPAIAIDDLERRRIGSVYSTLFLDADTRRHGHPDRDRLLNDPLGFKVICSSRELLATPLRARTSFCSFCNFGVIRLLDGSAQSLKWIGSAEKVVEDIAKQAHTMLPESKAAI